MLLKLESKLLTNQLFVYNLVVCLNISCLFKNQLIVYNLVPSLSTIFVCLQINVQWTCSFSNPTIQIIFTSCLDHWRSNLNHWFGWRTLEVLTIISIISTTYRWVLQRFTKTNELVLCSNHSDNFYKLFGPLEVPLEPLVRLEDPGGPFNNFDKFYNL